MKYDRRARLSALLFLSLMMHALFVCLTHHHDIAPLSHTTVINASDSDSPATKDTGSDAACLSCRLQRNCIADPHTPTFGVELLAETIARQVLLANPHTQRLA